MNQIVIEFYDDSCEVDAYGCKPKRRYVCGSMNEAQMALGMIDRHEQMPSEEEAIAEKVKNF